jgi:hypothetical protein
MRARDALCAGMSREGGWGVGWWLVGVCACARVSAGRSLLLLLPTSRQSCVIHAEAKILSTALLRGRVCSANRA